jgi:hypothetical protein
MDVHPWHLGWPNHFAAIQPSRPENGYTRADGYSQPERQLNRRIFFLRNFDRNGIPFSIGRP